jgi:hypothetical protein
VEPPVGIEPTTCSLRVRTGRFLTSGVFTRTLDLAGKTFADEPG